VRVFFHVIHREAGGWVPVPVGGPPTGETPPVLPPGAEIFIQIPVNVRQMFGQIVVSEATCVVSIDFTDATGNRWERDPRGALNPRI
jgi:hypothetical protein